MQTAIDPKIKNLQIFKESFDFYPAGKVENSFTKNVYDQLLTIIAGLKMEIGEMKRKEVLSEQDENRNSR